MTSVGLAYSHSTDSRRADRHLAQRYGIGQFGYQGLLDAGQYVSAAGTCGVPAARAVRQAA